MRGSSIVKRTADSRREAISPSRLRKRFLAPLVASGVALLSAELLSLLGLWWLEGSPFAAGALNAERARLIAQAGERAHRAATAGAAGTGRLPSAAGQPNRVGAWQNLLDDPAHAQRALHPYLGYVYDPALDGLASRRLAGFPDISNEGFYEVPASAGVESAGPTFTVAVFGGSMATLLALDGRDALLGELRGIGAARGKTLLLRCYALGGYKQPQQLIALAYLLSLGERPDLVINLDGLNELALPYAENRPRGVFPYYPRSWDSLAQATVNPAALERAGLVSYLRGRRARLAGVFSGPVLRYWATGNLVWRSLDRRLQRRIGEANVALTRLPSGPSSFAATGPRRTYASDAELFADLARSWQTASLLMSRLAAANGILYFHFLQPNQFDPGAKPIGSAEAARALDPGSPFGEPVRQGYPLLSRAGEELRRSDVRFFDLRTVFARVEAPLYIDKCCHVSREGSALLAQAIGRAIRDDVGGDGVAEGQRARGSSH